MDFPSPLCNKKKPGKVRLTQDAAARTNGKCLNDWLRKGADLTNRLVDVLLQARLYQYLVKGDIRDFFFKHLEKLVDGILQN